MDTKKLRQKILDLAIHGKLVPQDPNDEPASVLLERIREEKERLVKEGKIKKSKKSATSDTSHYENVPFEVPEGWCWCSVGDIVYDLKYGTSKKSSESGSVPVLRMGNLTRKGTISYDNLVYSSDSSDIEEYELTTGDLLFNRTNSSEWVGKTALYDGKVKSIYAGYLIRVRTIIINSEYLNIVMNSQYYRNWCYSVKTDAVNQSNINANKLASLLVPIPPISEQNQIVQEVTKMTEFIDLIEQGESDLQSIIGNIKSKILELAIHGKLVPQDANDEPASELLKRINPKAVASCDNPQYVNRMFEEMNMNYELPVGWCWCRLEELFQFIRNGKNIKQIKGAKGYPITRIETISNSKIDRERMGYANITQIYGFEDYVLRNGDILMSHINSPIHVGKSALCCNISKDEVILHGMNLLCLRPHPGVDSFYLDLYFKSSLFRNLIRPYIKNAVNQASINTKNVGQTYIPFPPKEEQKRLVNKVTELYSLLLQIELSLQA